MGEGVQGLAQRLVKWDLEYLLIECQEISGQLSVLFRHCLPSLTHLVLSHCGLNSNDMRCLTEVREQGRLPRLRYLMVNDVNDNRIKDPEMWTKNETWKNVKITLKKKTGSVKNWSCYPRFIGSNYRKTGVNEM